MGSNPYYAEPRNRADVLGVANFGLSLYRARQEGKTNKRALDIRGEELSFDKEKEATRAREAALSETREQGKEPYHKRPFEIAHVEGLKYKLSKKAAGDERRDYLEEDKAMGPFLAALEKQGKIPGMTNEGMRAWLTAPETKARFKPSIAKGYDDLIKKESAKPDWERDEGKIAYWQASLTALDDPRPGPQKRGGYDNTVEWFTRRTKESLDNAATERDLDQKYFQAQTEALGKEPGDKPLTPSAKLSQRKLEAWEALDKNTATDAQKKQILGTNYDKNPYTQLAGKIIVDSDIYTQMLNGEKTPADISKEIIRLAKIMEQAEKEMGLTPEKQQRAVELLNEKGLVVTPESIKKIASQL